jgi:DNA-binding NarL/FixJ family response regulator
VPSEQRPNRGIRVLVVDDHRLFADVLSMRLEQESSVEVAVAAYALNEARALAQRLGPHLVILDYHIDDGVATSLIPDLQQLRSPPTVLMLSATDDPRAIIESLDCGAAGWVVKGAQIDVLIGAVHEVLAGHMYLYPSTVRPVVEELMGRNKRTHEPSFVDRLSERQLDVLRCLVAGMTRAETSARLFITPNTVRTHVQNLLKVADEHSTLALVARARELGVVDMDEDGPRDRSSSS